MEEMIKEKRKVGGALDDMETRELFEEADMCCGFIDGLLDMLTATGGYFENGLKPNTLPALTWEGEQKVERIRSIIDILRDRKHEIEKAA